jgi:membrane-associated phospholipid phosphatase
LLARLTLIDRLYLLYLAAIALLALWRGPSGLQAVYLHSIIALLIILLAVNRSRSVTLALLHDWYPLAMFIFSFEEISRFSLALVGYWQDHRLISVERSLLGSPNIWIGEAASRPFSEFMDFGYFTYYPMFPVVGSLLYASRDKAVFRRLMLSSVLMYLISFTVYIGFPCEGPRRALPGFVSPPAGYLFSWLVRLIQGGAGVHGNALPSSHVGLAVLCTLFAYRWKPRLGAILATCAALICAGAVYDGYHYVSDVLAGVIVALTSYRLGSLIVNLDSKNQRSTKLLSTYLRSLLTWRHP